MIKDLKTLLAEAAESDDAELTEAAPAKKNSKAKKADKVEAAGTTTVAAATDVVNAAPAVTSASVVDSAVANGADPKPVDNDDKLAEAIDAFNKFVDTLHEEDDKDAVDDSQKTKGATPVESKPAEAKDAVATDKKVVAAPAVTDAPAATAEVSAQVVPPAQAPIASPEVKSDDAVKPAASTGTPLVATATTEVEKTDIQAPAVSPEVKTDDAVKPVADTVSAPVASACDGKPCTSDTCTAEKPCEDKAAVDDDKTKIVVSKDKIVLPEGILTVKGASNDILTERSKKNDDKAKIVMTKDKIVLPEGELTVKPGVTNDTTTVVVPAEHSEDDNETAVEPQDQAETSGPESIPEVNTDGTVDSAKSTEDTSDKVDDKEVKNKDAEKDADIDDKDSEKKTDSVATEKTDDEKKCTKCKSLKDVVKAGTAAVKTDEDKEKLSERLAILLAKENSDLLYEEYEKTLADAVSLRKIICEKYEIVAHNRTNDLLESMSDMETKISSAKNEMFKKLNEQLEINSAKARAKTLTPDEAAFTDVTTTTGDDASMLDISK